MSSDFYASTWLQLNTPQLSRVNFENITQEFNRNFLKIQDYFNTNNQLKIIYLSEINDQDQQFLLDHHIDISYLLKNLKPSYFNIDPRGFQLRAVENQCFKAICPFTGDLITSYSSFFISYDSIFYYFATKKVFYVITSHLGEGFKKEGIYFPHCQLLVKTRRSSWSITNQTIIAFKSLMVTYCDQVQDYLLNHQQQHRKTTMVLGSDNFAHTIFNELSGVYRLYQHRLLDKVDHWIVLRETLGTLESIFPEIDPSKIMRINLLDQKIVQHEIQCQLFEEGLKNNSFIIQVGDTFIATNLAERVYQMCVHQPESEEILEEIAQIKKNYFPLVWISIRTVDRTWVNQIDGFTNIIKSLKKDFPTLAIIFDGFSQQADTYLSGKLTDFEKKQIEEQQQVIEAIFNNLKDDPVQIINTIGCSIHRSNLWANAIDFYICHHGTIQHKVGWLANKPGIVHGNSKVLKSNQDHIKQAREKGIEPIYLLPTAVRDVKLNKNDLRNNLDNYELEWETLYTELMTLIRSKSDSARSTLSPQNLLNKLLNSSFKTLKNPSLLVKTVKKRIKKFLKLLIYIFNLNQL